MTVAAVPSIRSASRLRRLAANARIPALLLLICIAFHWKLVLTNQYTWVDQPDTVFQVMPWLQMESVQWRHGQFPLWDPYQWGGMPIAGQVQPGVLNPLNWILFSIPFKSFITVSALHWYFVLLHFLAVLFCYLLCRDMGISEGASIIAGCGFGLGGFLGSVKWPQIFCSALWLPLLFLFLFRAFRGARVFASAAASGSFLGLCFLSGHHNIPEFTAVFAVVFWAYYVLAALSRRDGRVPRAKEIWGPVVFFTCAALISAVQVLPAVELGQLSVRWVGAQWPIHWNETVPYSVHDDLSPLPADLPGLILPLWSKDTWMFIGLVQLVFACAAIAARWHDRTVRLLTAFAAGALAFTLGSFSILHGIAYAIIPGLNKARHPGMAIVLFELPIAVLAGYGLDEFLQNCLPVYQVRTIFRALLIFAGLILLAIVPLRIVRPQQSREYDNPIMEALIAIALALLFWASKTLALRTREVCLLLLLVIELNPAANGDLRLLAQGFKLPLLRQHSDIAAFLRSRAEPVRVSVDSDAIPYNFGDWYSIDQFGGYEPGVLSNVIDTQANPVARRLLGVNYYVGSKPAQPNENPVFDAASGLHVFQISDALPKLRVVHRILNGDPKTPLDAALNVEGLDPSTTVLLRGESATLETCATANQDAKLVKYRPASLRIQANLPCKGMVLLNDIWYPGWNVYVDGVPQHLYKAYGLIRGVVVPAGTHEIKMEYRPLTLFLGAGLTALGLLLCGAIHFVDRSSDTENWALLSQRLVTHPSVYGI